MANRNKSSHRKAGRPKIQEEIRNQKNLRRHFDNGLESDSAAFIEGVSERTVRRYFSRWKKQLIEKNDQDLEERQKIAKARLIFQYDLAIHRTTIQLDRLVKAQAEHEKAWKRNHNPQNGKHESYMPDLALEREIFRLYMQIVKLCERKAVIEASPFVNEETEKALLQKTQQKEAEMQEIP